MTRPWLIAALLAAASGAHAQAQGFDGDAPTGEELAWEEARAAGIGVYYVRVAETLAASDGARELAFAALLRKVAATPVDSGMPRGDAPSQHVPADAQVEAWRRRAESRAGDDIVANLLLVATDDVAGSATRARAIGRWQAADAGNLVPLLSSGLPIDAVLVEARRTTHADAHLYDTVRWMQSALLRHPPTGEEQAILAGEDVYREGESAALMAMGIAMTLPSSGSVELTRACSGEALRTTQTRTVDCRHVAAVLADRSDTALGRSIGLAMLHELADDAEQRSAIEARRRRMDWQMFQWARIAQAQPRDGAAEFVRLLDDASIRTEQQLTERVLQDAGVPLDPPPGWSPPRR